MNRAKRVKKVLWVSIPLLILIVGLCSVSFIRAHTFTLSGDASVKQEEIQPVFGKVKVTGTADTSVTFTDVKTGKTYTIGYITPGAGDSVQLERGSWYTVEGTGDLTVRTVNVRVA